MMTHSIEKLVHESPEMASLVDTLRLIAQAPVSVLIQGEVGTGKTTLARVLAGERATVLPAVELGAEQVAALVESGVGCLLLEEIDRLSPSAQDALLYRMDAAVDKPLRVIATTSVDLSDSVAAKRFRQGLFYRLNTVTIPVPALRSRVRDIAPLARQFCGEWGAKQETQVIQFSAAALALLKKYTWPGNVRELRNLCERLSILLPGKIVAAENLPAEIRDAAGAGHFGALDLVGREVEAIKQALTQAGGNKSQAARLLGISRDTLNYRLRKYGL